jgi:hypothetical protein
MRAPVTLIITNSFDLTVDRLIDRVGSERIFRFNFDLWREYQLRLSPGDFSIRNPAGREVRRGAVSKLYWRKPLSRYRLLRIADIPFQARYLEEEMLYAVREIKNLLWMEGKVVLVEPAGHRRAGKLVQMEIGARFFQVPAWEFFFDPARRVSQSRVRVVKSLSSEPVTPDTVLWTTRINEAALDRNTPWFAQDLVEAALDVTVVFVRGRAFGFSLDRRSFLASTVDWREVGQTTIPLWAPHPLPPELDAAIGEFMAELNLDYGRLDFLYDAATYWFLEVNTNGEWDWLDPTGDAGLLDRIAEEIHPDSPTHAIPTRASARGGRMRPAAALAGAVLFSLTTASCALTEPTVTLEQPAAQLREYTGPLTGPVVSFEEGPLPSLSAPPGQISVPGAAAPRPGPSVGPPDLTPPNPARRQANEEVGP